MNKVFLIIGFIFLHTVVFGQISKEAWEGYAKSTYQNISNKQENDATIIFDRTYLTTNREREKVDFITTIHRKIKINSLYGLEQFNKLYIPTFDDINYKVEFLDCKAKIHKKGQKSIVTDTSGFVNTTLPANTPFYYKVDGNVKMLALSGINIGDEIEYIYSLKTPYDVLPLYFYKADREHFSSSNYCMEKSIYFDTEKFDLKIWPYNFPNGVTRKSDFSYSNRHGEGHRVMIREIDEENNELFQSRYIDKPYITYIIVHRSTEEVEEDSWSSFAKDFKPRRSETKQNYIFDGEKMVQAYKDIEKIRGIKSKYKKILDKINQPLQYRFGLYSDVKDDIDAAWSYAKILSKTAKDLKLPINFHFVKSKHYGKLDKSYQSLYQFQNIICSFKDEKGTVYYFPVLEPYSKLNEIRNEYQGVDCFSILQDETGKRSHEFGTTPRFNEDSFYNKEVNVNLKEENSGSLFFKVEEKLILSGNVWTEYKPFISHIIENKKQVKRNLKRYVEQQVVLMNQIDSVHNIEYEEQNNSFVISYSYDLEIQSNTEAKFVDFKMEDFVHNEFYTPFHQRSNRKKQGYISDEFDTKYKITLNLNSAYQWVENKLMKSDLSNSIANVKSSYIKNAHGVTADFEIKYNLEEFTPNQWKDMVQARDLSYDLLNANFYFRK